MIGQIVSGVFFMMIRNCIRSKVQLRPINETKCITETDILTVSKDEINLHSSFLIPLLFTRWIIISLPSESRNIWVINFFDWTSFFSFLAILVLIFVHWRKGPKCWTKIAPILFFGLTWFLFIVLPLTNIGAVIWYLKTNYYSVP